MNWTVEGTHLGTGEELLVRVNAETRDAAEARAADGGLAVRDCYPAGGEYHKGVRAVACVWTGVFGVPAVAAAIGSAVELARWVHGGFGPPAGQALGNALVNLVVFTCLAALGVMVIRTTTAALKRPTQPDRRHGFPVAANAGGLRNGRGDAGTASG